MVVAAGFTGFEIAWRADVFAGAPQQSSAEKFGTLGINFRASRPGAAMPRAAEGPARA